MVEARHHAEIIADKIIAQNANALTTDFTVHKQEAIVRITLAISSAVKVKLVPSSGTALYFNAGAVMVAATVYTEEFALDTGRTWNIQTDDSGGTTVYHLVVQEIVR